jgi:hypothetical protein
MQRLRRPAKIARGKRDFGFCNDAPRACHGFFWTEGPLSRSQQRPRALEIAELCDCDTAKRERRRIVAQRDPLQRAKGITLDKSACRGCNQRIHRNPATLVTLLPVDTCISICT